MEKISPPCSFLGKGEPAVTDWNLFRSAIHQSIESGSVMACEFLILNGAKTTAADENGDTALHIAANHGSTGQVNFKTIPKG